MIARTMSEPAVRWSPPANVLAAIAAVRVRQSQGSPEDDGRPVQLAPRTGVVALGQQLKALFPLTVGPPQLRAGSAHHRPGGNRDVHEEGRAIDLMIPSLAYGEQIANFVSLHADALGIQGVIFRRSKWFSSAPRATSFGPYGGTSPHTDHVHLEVGPDFAGRSSAQVAQVFSMISSSGGGGGGGGADGSTTSYAAWYAAAALLVLGGAAIVIITKDHRK